MNAIIQFEKKIIISIFKDTSDSNIDSDGGQIEFEEFIQKPKKQYIHEYDSNNSRVKTTVITKDNLESHTDYTFDSRGNLILSEYNRLGYIQHKNQHEYDAFGNITKLTHWKDVSHGNERFEKETEATYIYSFDDGKIRQDNFKYVEGKRIHRGINEYEFVINEQLSKVKLNMLHLKTKNEITYFKKYDKLDNLIEDYSIQNEKYHPHSMIYKYEYDSQFNWISRRRETMDKILTLYSERKINLLKF